MKSTDQRRAAHALSKIKELEKEGGYDKFVSYLNSLPSTIITNGLGQAMAMELALYRQGKKYGHKLLFDIVESWLQTQGRIKKDLLSDIMNNDQEYYRLAQVETLSYLNWLKKFARAYLKDEDEENDQE
jgi:CRISPR-associated protein Cmr5